MARTQKDSENSQSVWSLRARAAGAHQEGNTEGSNNANFYIVPAQTTPRSPFTKNQAHDAVCWSNANLSEKSLHTYFDAIYGCAAFPLGQVSPELPPHQAPHDPATACQDAPHGAVRRRRVRSASRPPTGPARASCGRDHAHQEFCDESGRARPWRLAHWQHEPADRVHGPNSSRVSLNPSDPVRAMPTAYDAEFPKSMANVESHARSLALRVAKQRGKADAIVRRDVKVRGTAILELWHSLLQAARDALMSATDALVKKFVYYENARSVFIYHELRQFRELQTQFFRVCTSSFETHEHRESLEPEDGDREPTEQLQTQLQKKLSLTNQGS
ncbi:hypothetical protein FI667_g6658, partial [Globisporangium splendens]